MKYWVVIDKEQKGPFTFEELKQLPLTAQTPVWHKGMADWAPLMSRPELVELLPTPTIEVGQAEATTPFRKTPVGNVAIPLPVVAKCPPTYFILSSILTAFGLMIFGILTILFGLISLFFGWRVTKFYRERLLEKASRASERAALFNILNIVLTLIMIPFSVVFAMLL